MVHSVKCARKSCALVGALLLILASMGCGGDGDDGDAVDLTKRLPAGADHYAVSDLAVLREDYDLPDDADPLSGNGGYDQGFLELATRPLAGLLNTPDPDVFAALDLGAVQAAALSSGGGADVTVLATNADTGDVGSALGDLGFEDQGGILGKGGGSVSFRLDEGLIYAAGDPAQLRDLPDDPLDEIPDPLLEAVEGAAITLAPGLGDCTSGIATAANADGSGELAVAVDGGADASRLKLEESSSISFGDPEVDGDVVKVSVESEDGADGALIAVQRLQVTYDCG